MQKKRYFLLNKKIEMTYASALIPLQPVLGFRKHISAKKLRICAIITIAYISPWPTKLALRSSSGHNYGSHEVYALDLVAT